jgi:hypothetical protein
MIQPQFPECLFERVPAGYRDPQGGHAARRPKYVLIAPTSHDPLESVQHRADAHGNDPVTVTPVSRRPGIASTAHVFQVRALDDQGAPFRRFSASALLGGKCLRLLERVDAKERF